MSVGKSRPSKFLRGEGPEKWSLSFLALKSEFFRLLYFFPTGYLTPFLPFLLTYRWPGARQYIQLQRDSFQFYIFNLAIKPIFGSIPTKQIACCIPHGPYCHKAWPVNKVSLHFDSFPLAVKKNYKMSLNQNQTFAGVSSVQTLKCTR